LFGGNGRDNIVGGLGADRLNGIERDDTFNQLVARDILIGGIRPSGRRTQVRPALEPGFQLLASNVKAGPTAKVENPQFQSPPAFAEEIDEAFMEPLEPELLEL